MIRPAGADAYSLYYERKPPAGQFAEGRLRGLLRAAPDTVPDAAPSATAEPAAASSPRQRWALSRPLPDPQRDFLREPLTVRELNTIRAHRAAGLAVPDYPLAGALGVSDFGDRRARAATVSGLQGFGWRLGEGDLDWERIQVSANAKRRLAEDHLGRTVLQYKSQLGWQNIGDIRAYDGLGNIFRPPLQARAGGELALFGPFADPAQIDEILEQGWLPSYFDGSRFHAHERPRYRDDGSLIAGGDHDPYYRPLRYRGPIIDIRPR